MTLSPGTLFRYISRHFLVNLLLILAVLLGLIYVLDLIELARRADGKEEASFAIIVSMAALKLPEIGQQVVPFAVLFGAIYTCWKLNKTHELIVIRAAGLSAWQFLSPMILSALAFGILATTVINPLAAIFLTKYEQMEASYLEKSTNLVTISRTGIWLRQPVESGYALIHAQAFDQREWTFSDVSVLFFNKEDDFQNRIDSPLARLRDGYWDLRQAIINDRNGTSQVPTYRLNTELTANKIEESFGNPETISFWRIPEYLSIMKETGFPSTRLKIHFQSLLAQPLLLAAMVLLAATFSLRPPRFGATGLMIALGVAVGFFIFFMESLLHAFGISQKIPAYLAAWTPAVVSLLLGMSALLHKEDG